MKRWPPWEKGTFHFTCKETSEPVSFLFRSDSRVLPMSIMMQHLIKGKDSSITRKEKRMSRRPLVKSLITKKQTKPFVNVVSGNSEMQGSLLSRTRSSKLGGFWWKSTAVWIWMCHQGFLYYTSSSTLFGDPYGAPTWQEMAAFTWVSFTVKLHSGCFGCHRPGVCSSSVSLRLKINISLSNLILIENNQKHHISAPLLLYLKRSAACV